MIKFKIASCEVPSTVFRMSYNEIEQADEESLSYYRIFSLICDKGTEENLVLLTSSVSAKVGLSYRLSF